MIAKTQKDIDGLRTAGRLLAEVLDELALIVAPGVTTADIDLAAEKAIRLRGATPVFLGYRPEGAAYAFPAVICISVNEEVVHGIPLESHTLIDGDIVTLDLGLSYEGYFADSAITVGVGECDDVDLRLMSATREALDAAIAAAVVGGHVGDIGAAVEMVAQATGFSIVEDLGGHAIGKKLHEKPFIANFGKKGTGEVLKEGMALALEPMLSVGSPRITVDEEDEWTIRTADGSRAAHFEHTILITKNGPEVLTRI